MPALIEPSDLGKIQAAKILNVRYLDNIDSLPMQVIDYVDTVKWDTTKQELCGVCCNVNGKCLGICEEK